MARFVDEPQEPYRPTRYYLPPDPDQRTGWALVLRLSGLGLVVAIALAPWIALVVWLV